MKGKDYASLVLIQIKRTRMEEECEAMMSRLMIQSCRVQIQ